MKKIILILMTLCTWQAALATTTLSTVTGAWYDENYDGSGFTMAETPNGLFVYYYGYKGNGDGEAQWLLSKAMPGVIEKGQTYGVDMVSGFVGNGGSFMLKPITPNSGTENWGTLELTFNSCNAGTATLTGKDGQVTHQIKKLGNVVGLNCQESTATSPALIKTSIPNELGAFYRSHFNRYIGYAAPNGKSIHIVAQNNITDEQMLRAYNILKFYLSDYPGSQYGADKSAVANAMANNNAILALLNGADDGSNPITSQVTGQPLYQNEIQVEGSDWYMQQNYDHRDATFEEVFHLVHGHGIGIDGVEIKGALPEFQAEIKKAQVNGLANNIWGRGEENQAWIEELTAENSLTAEYLVSVIDSYYGLWGAWQGGNDGMWGVYNSKTREDIKTKDPMGYALMNNKFFHPYLTYNARIDASLNGNFSLKFDQSKPYTHHSRYLKDVTLLGTNNNSVTVNELDNNITGNAGVNTVIFSGKSSEYKITKNNNQTIVADTVAGRDGTNTLTGIEKLQFSDGGVASRQFGIFKVLEDNKTVEMNGIINSNSLVNFNKLKGSYPNIQVINIKNCEGSMDDETNLKLSLKVHKQGIKTHLMDNGEISSGGVDFFLAGVERTKGKNTKIGVHSWAADNDEIVATDFPVGHNNHLPYINYYKAIGFSQKQAEDFYYFTINAAPAESIHWMTAEEIKKYHIVTT